MTDPAPTADEALRAALLNFLNEYEVDGRRELHDSNCLYRKLWAMGGEDEPRCVQARAALASQPAAEELRQALVEIYDGARRFNGVCRWCDAPPPDSVHDHDVACPAAKAGSALHLPGYDDWTTVADELASKGP